MPYFTAIVFPAFIMSVVPSSSTSSGLFSYPDFSFFCLLKYIFLYDNILKHLLWVDQISKAEGEEK
jgi:hypothetical protein